MNPYRMSAPPKWWPPALKPRLLKLLKAPRRWQRVRDHKLVEVSVHGTEGIRESLAKGHGVLITPNHSTHADAYAMYEVSDAVGSPFYFMATWHLFTARTLLGRRILQWHGVFSVDREGTDLQAFKQAVNIVQERPQPLVIFPEGEVYHCNDRVTPFREGAAVIALTAAKRAKRPVDCVPCAMKYEYIEDPTDTLLKTMAELEQHIHWRPRPDLPLGDRIYKFAEAAMAVKEIEYYGHATTGTLPERTAALGNHILRILEDRYGIEPSEHTIPERVKELRRISLEKLQELDEGAPARDQINMDLDNLFLVVQLFSYPGDYVAEQPSVERLAETLDKFEEDVLGRYAPNVRAARRMTAYLGDPIPVPTDKKPRVAAPELTNLLEQRVQEMLDGHAAK